MCEKPKPQLYVIRHNYANSSVSVGRQASCATVPINKQLMRLMEGQPRQKILTLQFDLWLITISCKKKLSIRELLSGQLQAMF